MYLQEEIKLAHNFDEIIGRSAALTKVLHLVEQVAATDATVLILGETGTGKEGGPGGPSLKRAPAAAAGQSHLRRLARPPARERAVGP